jgi:signal transduction histidine kinase/ActR/RegA family two-component response regulator
MHAPVARRHTLRARLIGAFAVAALLPVGIVLAIQAGAAARNARSTAEAALRRSVGHLQARLDTYLDSQTHGIPAAAGVDANSALTHVVREAHDPHTRAQILNPSGVVVASSHPDAEPPRSPARVAAVAPLIASPRPIDGTPFWYEAADGTARLAAVVRTSHGWRAVVDMPRTAVYAEAWRSSLVALLMACGALLIAGVVVAHRVRRITRPLEGLVAAAAGLGDADAPLPAFDGAPDEVARLAADFSRMVTRASAMRADLEQQVVTRTAELSEARDRAEREARLKGVFLAAMSHEIRTPMNSIVGMAELMAETPLDAEQREYCDTIRTSTDALLGVINDILDFSKIEAQGLSLETLDFDLRLVVEDAVELLAVKAATTGLDLAALVEPGFDGRFRGDPSRVRQVVMNLLGNAVKFTTRGSVVVRLSAVERGADARVRVEVIDTGIGMTPDGLARLFQPFAQAEESTARQYGGTGLGLTISKQIVERMGGDIGVTSEPGHGTTFWFELPFPRSTTLAPPPVLTHPVADALVLEPHDASADAIVRLLTELGVRAVRVTTAGDGLAALDASTVGFAAAFVSVDAIDVAPFVDALQQHPSAGRTAIAAIVPAGRRAGTDLDRLRSSHRLTRPIRRARLVDCLEAIALQPGFLAPAGAAPAASIAPTAMAAAVAPASTPSVEPSVEAGTAPRILVADDYFANQRLVTRLLEKRGCTVEAVGDGQAAVDAALAARFDVVLMDCNMPVLDGYEATARIRALEQGRRTPILAMTANDSTEDRDACLRAGMDEYLVKPIQAAIVIAAVERWTAIARAQPSPAGAAVEPVLTPGGTR